MSLLLAVLAAAQPAPAPSADRVMMCLLQPATLSDPANPMRMVPSGPRRLLSFRLTGPTTGEIPGSGIVAHDPTTILDGRSVISVTQNERVTGFILSGTDDDRLALVVSRPTPGRVSGESYVTRIRAGHEPSFFTGSCAYLPTNDAAAAFEGIKRSPATIQ